MRKITYEELIEWAAYYELEPWGSQLDGIRMAYNTSTVFNAGLMNASPKQYNSKRSRPKHFFVGVNQVERDKPMHWKVIKKIMSAGVKSGYIKMGKLDVSR